jgi:HTH-type transcriptional regulator/antitoxin HigA
LVRAIVTEDDHDWALHRIAKLMEPSPPLDSVEGYELDALFTLVEAYENRHFPMGLPGPIAFIKFMMEQKGLTRKDLEPMIGSRARVSEVLSGRRNLTLSMIRKLHRGLDISPEYLIGSMDMPLKAAKKRAANPKLKKSTQAKPAAAGRRRVAA